MSELMNAATRDEFASKLKSDYEKVRVSRASREPTSALLSLQQARARRETFDWSKVSPVEKLMARRAARLDALRELSELVKGLPIGNGRTLGDLGPDSSVFLTGAAEVGQPKYLPTGFCKLTMRLAGFTALGLLEALLGELLTTGPGSPSGRSKSLSLRPELNWTTV